MKLMSATPISGSVQWRGAHRCRHFVSLWLKCLHVQYMYYGAVPAAAATTPGAAHYCPLFGSRLLSVTQRLGETEKEAELVCNKIHLQRI